MRPDEYELSYPDNARSVHTLLRVIDPESGDVEECLFDNLATPVAMVAHHGWPIVEEVIGFASTAHHHPLLVAWREQVSGGGDEALVVNVHGDPAVARGWAS